VIINAAECEPYITGDHRTMLERPDQVVKGAALLAKCFGVDKVYIGVEANKRNAADVLNAKIAELKAPVVVEVLHTRYPQGAEKQLCQAISGRQVPSGKLPADAGCCIFNLNTTCAIYKAVYTGMPVVSKVVTVSGSGVIEPKNLECPIGTPISNLFDACGGLKDNTYKLIMGGPMMGMAQYTTDVSVGKGTGCMLAFAGDEEQYVADPQCIRCGKCVGVCPIRLEPVFMYKYLMKGNWEAFRDQLHGMDCIECGACTYTCPARLPLTHAFRMGKQQVNNARMAAKARAEAEKAQAAKKEA
jgi:electron transport complex protein RnfC